VQRIDCTSTEIRLNLPLCASAISKATLSRARCLTHELQAVLVDPGTIALSEIPADLRRGVWTLTLTTDCGCYSAPMHVDICQVPGFISTPTPTNDGPFPTPVCCDTDASLA